MRQHGEKSFAWHTNETVTWEGERAREREKKERNSSVYGTEVIGGPLSIVENEHSMRIPNIGRLDLLALDWLASWLFSIDANVRDFILVGCRSISMKSCWAFLISIKVSHHQPNPLRFIWIKEIRYTNWKTHELQLTALNYWTNITQYKRLERRRISKATLFSRLNERRGRRRRIERTNERMNERADERTNEDTH